MATAKDKTIIASTAYERIVHWFLAIPCLLLVLTGVILAFRSFEPLAIIFGGYKSVVIIHRACGVIFTIALFLGIQIWYKYAGYLDKSDIQWLMNAGGYLWKADIPKPYKYNAGQKLFFLTVAGYGVVMVITGFLLFFKGSLNPTLMSWVVAFHALGVMIIGGFAMVHIYLGTIGTEGSLYVMTDGKVSKAWAKTHMPGYYKEKIEGKKD
ncbi:MAG: formate dehydrogenase subunit gamma [Deltaproteobacteria bacterium]|nr:formate dehydrogenase subunit gamma [Candidatus Zymogenaceae bacterium]